MRRVAAALAVALAAGAAAQAPAPPERELIYGAELMSAREREAYRKDVRAAPDGAAQAKVRERHRAQVRERARKRGVELAEPHGAVKRPEK